MNGEEETKMSEMIEKKQAESDVLIMTERLASLYYHMVQSIREEIGDEKAEEVVRRAILNYGNECGQGTRAKVEALGKEPTLANYALGKDLPSVGWQRTKCEGLPENERASCVTFCPFAAKWKEYGFEKWGRMYCHIDQAKYRSYNENLVCIHDKNQLDGDECCIVRIEDHTAEK